MRKSVGKSLSYVFVFTIIAKLLVFLREMCLSYFFGASGVSDAYLISQYIPGTIFLFVGTGLATSYIPVFFKIKSDDGQNEANSFTSSVLSMVLLFSTFIIVLVLFFTPFIVKLFASGFEGETFKYAILFTRICIFSLYFSSVIYVYSSFLQANDVFGITAFSSIPNSIVIMIAIICGAKINIWLLSIVSVLATAVQALVLIPSVHKFKYRFQFTIEWDKRYTGMFFKLLFPVVLGVSVNEINMLVDRTIASNIAIGAISALTYANSLIQLVQGGIVQPIITVYYPVITKGVVNNNSYEIERIVEKILSCLMTILLPITAAVIVFSHQIIDFVFGRGAFDSNAAILTSKAFLFYSLGICATGLRELVARIFYASSDTKTPMKNASIGMMINIVLNIFLSSIIGISGLALATSISSIISFVLLFLECRKKLTYINIDFNIKDSIKILASTVLFTMSSFFIYINIGVYMSDNLSLIISLILGGVAYILIGYWLQINSIKEMSKFLENAKEKHGI